LKPAYAKLVIPSLKNKPGVVVQDYNPSYTGSVGLSLALRKKQEPI
jgi:hypothetical protein